MTGHCEYRSPVIEAGHVGAIFPLANCKPDSWLCGCPAGEHALGFNCVDDRTRCKVAKAFEKDYLPSFAYKRRKRLPTAKEVAGRD